jgi:hypothetical protein
MQPSLPQTRKASTVPSSAISADSVDVFEEDPLVEAAALVPFAGRFRHDILPAHAVSTGQRLQDFQHVRQFRQQLPVRCRLRFLGLLISFARSATRYPAWSSTRVTG